MEFKKAFDSIKSNNIVQIVNKCNIRAKLIRLLKITVRNVRSHLRIGGAITNNGGSLEDYER